jgi:multidrug efflux system outer membrane protein
MTIISRSMNVTKGFLAVLLLGLSGCAVGPDYIRPEMEVPIEYGEGEDARYTVDEVQSSWWTLFNDSTLSTLVQDAARENKGVLQALSRINQSRAMARVAFAELLPGTQLNGSYTKVKDSGSRSPAEFSTGAYDFEIYSASVDAVWEIDIFGRLRRNLEARNAEHAAAVAQLQDSLRMVVAEVGVAYFELRGYQAQLNIAKENLEAQNHTSRIVKAKYQNGLVSELDVVRAQAVLAETRASVPPLESAVKRSIHRLAVLVGKYPKELESRLIAPASIPLYQGSVGIGAPEDLLRRRPDIRSAERMLASYTAQIGVAVGDLFPKVTLNGAIGVEAPNFSGLTDGGSVYSYGPSISWTPFDSGRLRARVKATDARAEEALLAYEHVVLVALEDVENALAAYTAERIRHERLKEAVTATSRAYLLAKDQYQEGVLDLLSVLDAERSKLQNESSLAQSETALATSVVGIYKALGGGWESWELANLDSNEQS